MTEPFFNEIRKRPEFQAELVVALEEELAAMMKEMEAKDAEIARLRVALEAASDFANSHSLPCLSDIVDTALEAKHD